MTPSRRVHGCAVHQRSLRRFLRAYADDLPPAAVRSATGKTKLRNWTVCTLKNAAVRPDRRGQGLGRRLYLDVTKQALKLRTKEGYPRCHVLAADVTHDNKPSIKALRRAGFKPINRFCWSKGQKPADILHYVRVSPRGTTCK